MWQLTIKRLAQAKSWCQTAYNPSRYNSTQPNVVKHEGRRWNGNQTPPGMLMFHSQLLRKVFHLLHDKQEVHSRTEAAGKLLTSRKTDCFLKTTVHLIPLITGTLYIKVSETACTHGLFMPPSSVSIFRLILDSISRLLWHASLKRE